MLENIEDIPSEFINCGKILANRNDCDWILQCKYCSRYCKDFPTFMKHIKQEEDVMNLIINKTDDLNNADEDIADKGDTTESSRYLQLKKRRITTQQKSVVENGNQNCNDGNVSTSNWAKFNSMQLLPPNATVTEIHQSSRSRNYNAKHCSLCGKTFENNLKYDRHMKTHSKLLPFTCNICDRGFVSKQAKRYHLTTHSREKPYKCPFCIVSSSTEKQYNLHLNIHKFNSLYPCLLCGCILSTPDEHCKHIESHNENGNQALTYSCSGCCKIFERQQFIEHLRLFSQYKCVYCGQDFCAQSLPKSPFSCTNCQNIFGNHQSNYNLFMNIASNDEAFNNN